MNRLANDRTRCTMYERIKDETSLKNVLESISSSN
jgi:hypothetical protein